MQKNAELEMDMILGFATSNCKARDIVSGFGISDHSSRGGEEFLRSPGDV